MCPVAALSASSFFSRYLWRDRKTDLFVELVGLVKPGDGADFDMVQLHR